MGFWSKYYLGSYIPSQDVFTASVARDNPGSDECLIISLYEIAYEEGNKDYSHAR